MQTLRWGILGTGTIATKFTQGLDAADGHHVAAVGSRTLESADRFGEAHGIPTRHGSYADLAADPEVDAIYVSTPHTFHRENTLLCLEGGKAVLCEKPFALNAAQAREMVAAARSSSRPRSRRTCGIASPRSPSTASCRGSARSSSATTGRRTTTWR